ncbi:hypothetical protein [Silvimonas sp.]|uniref:hypothetical protein n=1 Tax=Silvimonas sp. TaxID=2650811 RepID=UPI002847DA90|nr:hypothetical protein [Silvimonas sp.]MDR3428751.1 hypothetical protein [Silvimonas sp.]
MATLHITCYDRSCHSKARAKPLALLWKIFNAMIIIVFIENSLRAEKAIHFAGQSEVLNFKHINQQTVDFQAAIV